MQMLTLDLLQFRILGTPTNAEWEGVEELPAYKKEFPRWSRKDLSKLVPGLDRAGIDLLEVWHWSKSPYSTISLILVDM